MRRILEADEDLTLTMARPADVAAGGLLIMRRMLRYASDPTLNDEGVMLIRRALFTAYYDARTHGERDAADRLIKLAVPSPVARGGVIIKPAARRRPNAAR